MYQPGKPYSLSERFRGYLPVVVDVETGGFNERTDALLEIAAVILNLDEQGQLKPVKSYTTHVVPFDGCNINPQSLEVNGIDPYHPLRAGQGRTRSVVAYLHTMSERPSQLQAALAPFWLVTMHSSI